MKKILFVSLLLLAALIATLIILTMAVEPPRYEGRVQKVLFQADAASAADHLATALSYRTISRDGNDLSNEYINEFLGFQTFLEHSYPAVHSALKKTPINKHSLLYHWQGSSSELAPILLLAHYDVVPAGSKQNASTWQHPPFAGDISEGVIWGRGALDDKASLIAIMETIDALVREGYQPKRSIYLAFGHDEEIGGKNGAMQIARHLKEKELRFDFILDEGSMIGVGMIPGFDYAIAAIGPAEKGYLSLKLTSKAKGGHASMPPRHSAIAQLATAIHQLEENPFPIDRALSRSLYNEMLPHMPFGMKVILANNWLFRPLIDWAISNNPALNAGLRTTLATTIIEGGDKENVLPNIASATLNIRIIPGDSIAAVITRIKAIIDNENIITEILGSASEATKVSDIKGSAYTLIRRTIHQLSDNGNKTLVIPKLVVAATDARHYQDLSDQVLRFIYLPVTPETISGIHGDNERVAIKDLSQAIRFYYQLIRNSDTQL